ncbi:MAG: DNA-processing protein DprA [Oscillospiraceae bacterium]|nr:DNA-processing protein DprA [Oscillospiraceae bacterium]
MLYNEKIVYDVWLSMALRSCKQKIWQIIDEYGGCENVYKAFCIGTLEGFDSKEQKRLKETELSQAYKIIEHCRSKGYEIIAYYDELYPQALCQIYNPPIVLYCYGRTELLSAERKIAVVGTRKPSAYSVDVAKSFCRSLVENKYVIVSGFALGIDSVAHTSALKSGGYSIAVIGCGLDYPYPKENFNFRENFIKRGLIISEFIPQSLPEAWCFPHRNRIISGLCSGTVVIEAGENSGSLVTANLAAEQGRDVFCIPPHDIFDKSYGGNIRLLKNGAIAAFSYTDILEEYSVMDLSKIPLNNVPDSNDEQAESTGASVSEDIGGKIEDKNSVDGDMSDIDGLDEASKAIVTLLKKRDMLVDELGFETGIEMARLFLLLTELEIAGLVESKAGNVYGIAE